ncbi:5869_t:CDS:1 [Paraglomus brasilianum]|uniref:5869_t:CDS:1 n=1 Tax=Paraglomus brasilianum TaxID=144538 RepID=A0A9N8VK84_9GLOM|nr:5869_t:CDS:1 [Paraglomus brasilianum]
MNNQPPPHQICVRKFLRPDATPLTPEAIEEIRNAPENIPNACRVMCKKYHIGTKRYNDIIKNRMPSEPTEGWRRIIEEAELRGSVNKACVPWPSLRRVYICSAKPLTQTPDNAETFTKLDTSSETLFHNAVVPLLKGQVSDSYERTNMDSMVPPLIPFLNTTKNKRFAQ